MALVNEIEKLENYVTTAEQIKEKIKTTAENSGVTVENDDTPLSVLDKIGSELPSGENYVEWEAVNTQLEENIGDYANTPQKTLAQKIIDKSVTEITEWDLEGITTIGNYAFRNCSSLTTINIPDSVNSIGTYAFYDCTSLTEMTILAPTPPTLASINAISTATTTIYIPAGSKTAYETADKWKDLLTRDNPVTFVELEA